MIRIKKPIKPPAILQTRGEKAIKELGEQYDADPELYKGWTFDSSDLRRNVRQDRITESPTRQMRVL